MTHKIKAMVPVEKRTLFGKKTVMKEKTVRVDGKTYRKLKKAEREKPFSVEEMMLYDWLEEDD